jgi:hypothetical protein
LKNHLAVMKRRIDEADGCRSHDDSTAKKRAVPDDLISKSFREGFFDSHVLESYQREYADSRPYKHGVIRNLVSEELLRSVRSEIKENLQFSPKETGMLATIGMLIECFVRGVCGIDKIDL